MQKTKLLLISLSVRISDDTLAASFYVLPAANYRWRYSKCAANDNAAETSITGKEGRAASEQKAHAKTGNKWRLGNTLILSSDLQSDSLLYSFAAGSRPIRFHSSWQSQLFHRVNKVIPLTADWQPLPK